MALEGLVGRAPLRIRFYDDSTYPDIDAWFWTFGDGSSSSQQNPEYVYSEPGVYNVFLRILSYGNYYYERKYAYVKVLPGVLRVSYTDKCYRLAMRPEQGIGWSEYTGQLPFPSSGNNIEIALDDKNQQVPIIFDNNTGKPYRWSNRNGPDGSDMSEKFVDKESGSYSSGSEITCKIRFKEVRAINNKKLQHLLSSLKLQPQYRSNVGADGYTASGQRSGQEITMRIYKNGSLVSVATANDISLDSEIALDKYFEAEGLQVELEFATSEFRLTEFVMRYMVSHSKKEPSKVIMTEQTYANEFDLPVLWLTRGKTLGLNRADGGECSGSYVGAVTGPDSKTNSAMSFAAASNLSDTIDSLTGDMAISFWLSDITDTVTIYSTTNLTLSVRVSGSTTYLRWVDSNGTYEHQLSYSVSGWVHLAVVRQDYTLSFYENGALLGSDTIPIVLSVGGTTLNIMPAMTGYLFDQRIVGQSVSAEALAYYYDDVTNNNGGNFCPPW